jgi:hypothetical protein
MPRNISKARHDAMVDLAIAKASLSQEYKRLFSKTMPNIITNLQNLLGFEIDLLAENVRFLRMHLQTLVGQISVSQGKAL